MELKEKLQRTFVREEAYVILRDWIIEGKLEAGQKLRDKELAEQLGVSRTPIREALLRLEDEGLVVTKANRSTTVSPIDFRHAIDLYSIVAALEQLALQQSFEKIDNDHLEVMAKANESLLTALKANDRLAAVEADHAFHAVYIELSENNELHNIITGVKQKLKRLDIHYFKKCKNARLSYDEHLKIIKSLKNKDLPSALHALESNWKGSLSRLQPD